MSHNNQLNIENLRDDCHNQYYQTLSNLFNNIIKYKDKYIHTDNDGDYFIEVIGNTIYIYFEESDSWADWMSNFDFIAVLTKNIKLPAKTYNDSKKTWKAHRGFFRVWKSMRDNIESEVKSIIETRKSLWESPDINGFKPIDNIICIGYSHGAALCGLCVEDMQYLYAEKYSINVYGYGFGCPRFIWGKLPEDVKTRFSNFYVIRNGKDLVTHVPPRIFGYSHGTDNLIKINPTKKYGCIDAHRPESYTTELEVFNLNEYMQR